MDRLDEELGRIAESYRPTHQPELDLLVGRAQTQRRRRALAGTAAAVVLIAGGVAIAAPWDGGSTTIGPVTPTATLEPSPSPSPEVLYGCGSETISGIIDYTDFVKVGGVMMNGAPDLYSSTALAPVVREADLGEAVDRVTCRLADTGGRATTDHLDNGTASFLPLGTNLFAVAGYDRRCRVAAGVDGGYKAYLALDPAAKTAQPLACAVVPGLDPDAGFEQAGDPATAPAAFRDRTPLPDCGFVDLIKSVNQHLSAGTAAARNCFLQAVAARTSASVVVRSTSVDAGPVYDFLSTKGGATTAWTSVSSQMLGRGGPIVWTERQCVVPQLQRYQSTCATYS
jgi:hypothetical protein